MEYAPKITGCGTFFYNSPFVSYFQLTDQCLVKKLIEKGANIDYYNDANYRAYDYAKFNKNEELIDLLT